MENKKWLMLLLFSISLIGIISVMPHGKSADNLNVFFRDSTSKAGTVIHVDNTSFYNNLTSEIYKDDLITQRILESCNQTRIQWLTSIGTIIEYAYPLSPMDTNAFNRTQFYFYAQYTGRPKYINLSFEITTLNNDTTFNRTISINSNGTKYILVEGWFCKASYRYKVVSLQSGFTRFHIKLYQPRWGVIAKYNNNYYIKNAGITCYEDFQIMDKKITITENNIYFNLNSDFNNYVFCVAGQNDVTMTDVSMYVDDSSSLFTKLKWYFLNGRNINITRCYFWSNYSNEFNGAYLGQLNITDSLFNNVGINLFSFKNITRTIFTNTGQSVLTHYFKFYTGRSLNNCIFSNSQYGFYIYSTLHNYNVTDCLFKNVNYLMFPHSQIQTVHFINCTSDRWVVDDSYISPYLTGQTYRSYSFDLRAMNGSTAISSANVKIYDKAGILRYSGTTNSNGYITRQIFDYCVWNDTYPVTPYVFSNYRINLTKTNFRSVDYTFNNSIKLNLTVAMVRNTTTSITWSNRHINTTWSHYTILLSNNSWLVYDNDTGNTTTITWSNRHINDTWSHITRLLANNSWLIFDNDTGNTTTITWSNRHINDTWSHITRLLANNSWLIFDNDTGNTTTITWSNRHVNDTWSHITRLLANNSWLIFDNDTGNITTITWHNNHINTTWSHYNILLVNNSWLIYDNDTGNLTPIHLLDIMFNCTGSLIYINNGTGYWVTSTHTGNITIVPLSNFTVGLNFTNLPGYINWTGSYVANSTNISFVVTSNMSLLGNVTINSDDWLNIASFNINSQLLLLSIFFGLIYLWWKSEKVSMMFVLAMLIVPYDIVVMIVYLLPLYITDTAILLFMRILFLLISIVVMGYTVDYRSKNKKEEKQSGE